MTGFGLALAIFGVTFAVFLIGLIAGFRAVQLERQAACRDEFFAAAGRLIADPETPEKTIHALDRLAHALTSRTLLWGFVAHALTGRLRNSDTLRKEFFTVPDHLRADLVKMWVSAIFALTFNNLLLGALIRRLMLYSVPRQSDGDFASVTPVIPMVDEFAHDTAQVPA